MRFHEDTIFKIEGLEYGQKLMEILEIKGKIIKVHQTEYATIDPKMYKPDLVFELEDKIVILEFQSSHVDVADKRRFRFYTALFDLVKIKSKKPIELHVLSTVEMEKIKCYRLNFQSRFPIYIHSLKKYDGDKFLNRMNSKIKSNKNISEKEMLMIGLLCFMGSENSIDETILNSATTITSIKTQDKEIGQFVKGVILMLCDKFVKNETTNTTISNLVGGNMKIIEDYAQRKVDEKVNETKEEIVKNLKKEGYNTKDISRVANVSQDFVNKALSK